METKKTKTRWQEGDIIKRGNRIGIVQKINKSESICYAKELFMPDSEPKICLCDDCCRYAPVELIGKLETHNGD